MLNHFRLVNNEIILFFLFICCVLLYITVWKRTCVVEVLEKLPVESVDSVSDAGFSIGAVKIVNSVKRSHRACRTAASNFVTKWSILTRPCFQTPNCTLASASNSGLASNSLPDNKITDVFHHHGTQVSS